MQCFLKNIALKRSREKAAVIYKLCFCFSEKVNGEDEKEEEGEGISTTSCSNRFTILP